MAEKITSNELREKYLSFFEGKGHARIPAAPLVPEHDPSVLFTTAGMHPLVPYLKGQPHPAGSRLTNVQKSLRTSDIDDVGDATHATVFEMLGNWSLGDYFKREAIAWSWEFLTDQDWLGLDPACLAVSVFAGDADAPRDDESASHWLAAGVPASRIAYLGKEENWWPSGGGQMGPQGPDTEMFYWSNLSAPPKKFDPDDARWVEIWNDVFMQYDRSAEGTYQPLPQQNVDTGMGLERTVMILNRLPSIYEIDTYQPLMALINEQSRIDNLRQKRILADHIKAFTFILGDEVPVIPSKADQGYVVRRLIRRAVLALRTLQVNANVTQVLLEGMKRIATEYGTVYPSLKQRGAEAQSALTQELDKSLSSLDRGLAKFDQILKNRKEISGFQAFELYTTYGLPIEITLELAAEKAARVDVEGYQQEMAKHQKLSRTAAAGKFKGGLADHSEESVRYHTATHLLHQALRQVLGDHVRQTGSNITRERLRFDFSHPRPMSAPERQAVADLVNKKIQEDLPVQREEMSVAAAKATGALGLFEHKYATRVSVYTIGDFSREMCGGPHVVRTGLLGTFKITKEESAGGGIRRIKAVLT